MTVSEHLYAGLKAQGADYFVSVPCKLLGGLINLLEQDTSITYVPANKEEEGLGICAGAYLGGKTPGADYAKHGHRHYDFVTLLAGALLPTARCDDN